MLPCFWKALSRRPSPHAALRDVRALEWNMLLVRSSVLSRRLRQPMIQKIKNHIFHHPFQSFFWMSFCFTAGAALFIQIVLLPHLIPRLHAGHGLLVGGDWVGFHEMAVSQAQAISQHGWGRWKLRPAGHAQVGVASVFYTILVAEPWVLIPLNACLHAVATVLLARMLWMITGHRSISIVAALPFLLYPTSAAWYSQLHKEGYFIAGYFLCLFGWMRIAQLRGAHLPRGFLLASILVILAGTLTVGLVRDFGVKLVAVMGFFFAVILTIRLLVTHTKDRNFNATF